MRDIKGFEGKYAITSCGRVWSYRGKRFLKPHYDKRSGYATVELGCRVYKVHRLVAEAYLDNPGNLPFINHLDENRTNNSVNNLEWCTPRHNVIYSLGKPVYCNETKLSYPSISVAAEMLGIRACHISSHLSGEKYRKTVGGYTFRFL